MYWLFAVDSVNHQADTGGRKHDDDSLMHHIVTKVKEPSTTSNNHVCYCYVRY